MKLKQIALALIFVFISTFTFADTKGTPNAAEKELIKLGITPMEHDFHTIVRCWNGGVMVVDMEMNEIHYFNTWRFVIGYDVETEQYEKVTYQGGVCRFTEVTEE